MTTKLDINAILAEQAGETPGQRGKEWPPRVYALRRSEQVRRSKQAQTQAGRALTILHGEEYRELRKQAKEAIEIECGPLPGDPGWTE